MNTLRKYYFALLTILNMNKRNIKAFCTAICISFFTISIAQEGTVTVNQPEAINKLLELKKDIKSIDTYKIQIYSGTSRMEAERMESNFRAKHSDLPTEMVFQTPHYKIWAGNFRDRLEADRALLKVKKNYMNAFIFKPKKD